MPTPARSAPASASREGARRCIGPRNVANGHTRGARSRREALEGLRCDKLKAFSVQYHPEASPGPHDSAYLFETFIKFMKG